MMIKSRIKNRINLFIAIILLTNCCTVENLYASNDITNTNIYEDFGDSIDSNNDLNNEFSTETDENSSLSNDDINAKDSNNALSVGGNTIYDSAPTKNDIELIDSTLTAKGNGVTIRISGLMPKNAYLKVKVIQDTANLESIIQNDTSNSKYHIKRAYDITIYDSNGNEFQPVEYGSEVHVDIEDKAIESTKNKIICRVEDEDTNNATVTRLRIDNDMNNSVGFNTDHFTIYTLGASGLHEAYLKKGTSVNTYITDNVGGIPSNYDYGTKVNKFSIVHDSTTSASVVSTADSEYPAYVIYKKVDVDGWEMIDVEIHTEADVVQCNEDSSEMFNCFFGYIDLTDVRTDYVKNMYRMFHGAGPSTIKKSEEENKVYGPVREYQDALDVSKFNTSNVESMQGMLSNVHVREIKGLGNFDTSNVTNMAAMFGETLALTVDLDLSSFNTSKVTTMNQMFVNGGPSGGNLDLSSFTAESLETASEMCAYTGYSYIDMHNMDVSHLSNDDLDFLFGSINSTTYPYKPTAVGGTAGTGADKPKWYGYNTSLKKIRAPKGIPVVGGTDGYPAIGLPGGYKTGEPCTWYIDDREPYNVADNKYAYYRIGGGDGLSHTYIRDDTDGFISPLDNSNPLKSTLLPGKEFNALIKQLAGDSSATYESINNNIYKIVWSTNAEPSDTILSTSESPTPIYGTFRNNEIILSTEANIVFANKDSSYLLSNCQNIDTDKFFDDLDNANLEDISFMFQGCKFENMTLPKFFQGANINNINSMFLNCDKLVTLDLANLNVEGVTSCADVIYGCDSLVTVKSYESNKKLVKLYKRSNGVVWNKNNPSDYAYGSQTFTRYIRTTITNGKHFNELLKTLANSSTKTYTDTDTKIASISWTQNEITSIVNVAEDGYDPIYVHIDGSDITLYTEAQDVELNTDSSYMLYNMESLVSADFLQSSSMYSDLLTNADYMLDGCNNIESLDLRTLNFSNIESADNMMYNCTNLQLVHAPKQIPIAIKLYDKDEITWSLDDAEPFLKPDSNQEYTSLIINAADSHTYLRNDMMVSVLLPGQEFNSKIKQLADENNIDYNSIDTSITDIVFNEKGLLSGINVATDDSEPVYANIELAGSSTEIISTSNVSDFGVMSGTFTTSKDYSGQVYKVKLPDGCKKVHMKGWIDIPSTYSSMTISVQPDTSIANPLMANGFSYQPSGLVCRVGQTNNTSCPTGKYYVDEIMETESGNIAFRIYNSSGTITVTGGIFLELVAEDAYCDKQISLVTASKKIYLNADCSNMYKNMQKLKSLSFLNNSKLKESTINNTDSMLNGCSSLINVDLSKLDLNQVQNTNDMLLNCNRLRKVKSPYNIIGGTIIELPNAVGTQWYIDDLYPLDIADSDTTYNQMMTSNECHTYISMYSPTIILPGKQFNKKIKSLYGDREYTDIDSNIQNIRFVDEPFISDVNVAEAGSCPVYARTGNTTDVYKSHTPNLNDDGEEIKDMLRGDCAPYNDTVVIPGADQLKIHIKWGLAKDIFSNISSVQAQDYICKVSGATSADGTWQATKYSGTADIVINGNTANFEYYMLYGYVYGYYAEITGIVSGDEPIVELYSESDNIYYNEDSSDMFSNMQGLTGCNMLKSKVKIDNVKNISRMFNGCTSIEQIDMSNISINGVTYASDMLLNCYNLREVKSPRNINNALTIYFPSTFGYKWYMDDEEPIDEPDGTIYKSMIQDSDSHLYKAFETGETMLATGKEFNSTLKRMINSENDFNAQDTKIENIRWSESEFESEYNVAQTSCKPIYARIVPKVTYAYSYTQNIDATGRKLSDYSKNWSNSYIRGTGRESSNSQAHVITIPGASKLIVDLYYSSYYSDYVSVWAGTYPNYKAGSNAKSPGYVNTSMGAPNNNNKFGNSQSGTYNVNGNTLTNMGHCTLSIPGDSITFSFYAANKNYCKGYGYYAIVSGVSEADAAKDEETIELYTQAKSILYNEDSSDMLSNMKALKSAEFLKPLNSELLTNMNSMFKDCESIESIDISSIDATNITSASNLIDNCNSLSVIKSPTHITNTLNIPLWADSEHAWYLDDDEPTGEIDNNKYYNSMIKSTESHSYLRDSKDGGVSGDSPANLNEYKVNLPAKMTLERKLFSEFEKIDYVTVGIKSSDPKYHIEVIPDSTVKLVDNNTNEESDMDVNIGAKIFHFDDTGMVLNDDGFYYKQVPLTINGDIIENGNYSGDLAVTMGENVCTRN